MPDITRRRDATLSNYHATLKGRRVGELACFSDDGAAADPLGWLAASAGALKAYLGDLAQKGGTLAPAGARWSFTKVLYSPDAVIDFGRGGRVFDVDPAWLEAGAANRRFVLASGGATIRMLNAHLEPEKKGRLITTGSYDGQTLAGAIATGTHGTVMGVGPMQNQAAGIHFVTGPNSSVWLERASAPRLAPDAVKKFADRIIRDDEIFDGALVHLGAMGLVNAVLYEVAEFSLFESLTQRRAIAPSWIMDCAQGRFDLIAQGFGRNAAPYSYELTIDPLQPFVTPAFHSLLFRSQATAPINPPGGAPAETGACADYTPPTPLIPEIPPGFNIIDFYASAFEIFPNAAGEPRIASWGALHGPHTYFAHLFNAAFAIDLADLPRAVDVMTRAVGGLAPYFVFTVRFVFNAEGALAFTRFPNTAVINLDGAGDGLSPVANEAAMRAHAALDAAGVDFSLHWGKQGGHSAAKTRVDYGDAAKKGTRAWRFRMAREALLATDMQRLFRNEAAADWGLV